MRKSASRRAPDRSTWDRFDERLCRNFGDRAASVALCRVGPDPRRARCGLHRPGRRSGRWVLGVVDRSDDYPRLDDHATDRALDNVRSHYRQLHAKGEVVRGTVRLHPRVASVRGSTAIVTDCNDVTDFLRYDAKTGAPREERKTDIAEVEVTLRLVNGKWLVSKTVVKQPCKP